MVKIKFGTDGWRAVIGDQFTFSNVGRVARATARYFARSLKESSVKRKALLLIGYDNRFLSEEFAVMTARIFIDEKFKVLLSDRSIPTPVLSHAVLKNRACGGVMITASHNPPVYNGFKIKLHYGAAAPTEETKMIEQLLDDTELFDDHEHTNTPPIKSFVPPYVHDVGRMVDMRAVNNLRCSVMVDPMNGSGKDIIETLLKSSHMKIGNIRSFRDPLFGGYSPEPIHKNMIPLIQAVKANRSDIGICLDGDGDRISLVDGKGNIVNAHQILTLLAWHLIEYKKYRGRIIRSIASTYMIDRLSKRLGCEISEVPIGFKHITEQMLEGGVVIGGEESGGIGFCRHIPERDAVLAALYIFEMMAVTGKSLHQLTQALSRMVGPSVYERIDIKLPFLIEQSNFKNKVKKQYKRILAEKPKEIKDYDGVKFIWRDDSWLLLRMSGTEPVIRIYAESQSKQKTQKLLALGKQFQYNQ